MHAVIQHVLPPKALKLQKRYLRRIVRKPLDMTTRNYCSWYNDVNSKLDRFPPFAENQKMDDDEILENIEFGLPNKFLKKMAEQGFDPTDEDLNKMIEFCERIEFTKDLEQDPKLKGQKATAQKGGKDPKGGASKSNQKRSDATYNCLYHGKNTSHNTDQFKVLMDQASKMAAAHSCSKHQNKKARFTNKSWNRTSDKAKKENTKKMYAFVTDMVKRAMKGEKKRKDPPSFDMNAFNFDIDESFRGLNVSDSDSE